MFKHTSSLGIRDEKIKRHVLKREIVNEQTPYGEVRVKKSTGYGIEKKKYEYEDIVRIANNEKMSYKEVIEHL